MVSYSSNRYDYDDPKYHDKDDKKNIFNNLENKDNRLKDRNRDYDKINEKYKFSKKSSEDNDSDEYSKNRKRKRSRSRKRDHSSHKRKRSSKELEEYSSGRRNRSSSRKKDHSSRKRKHSSREVKHSLSRRKECSPSRKSNDSKSESKMMRSYDKETNENLNLQYPKEDSEKEDGEIDNLPISDNDNLSRSNEACSDDNKKHRKRKRSKSKKNSRRNRSSSRKTDHSSRNRKHSSSREVKHSSYRRKECSPSRKRNDSKSESKKMRRSYEKETNENSDSNLSKRKENLNLKYPKENSGKENGKKDNLPLSDNDNLNRSNEACSDDDKKHGKRSKSKKHKKTKSPKMSDEELLEYLRKRRQEAVMKFENEEIKEETSDPQSSCLSEKENSPILCEKADTPKVIEPPNKYDIFSDNFMTTPTNISLQNTQHDENDDAEGYYKIRMTELLDKRYQVFSTTGKGVFSNVIRARDTLDNNQEVAIKIIRNNEMMYQSGLKEIKFLEQINEASTNKDHNCVKFIRHFIHKNHLCMVFEILDMNLRSLVQKFGKKTGLNISAVRIYTRQLLRALHLLKKIDILHGDIKPDNILINTEKTRVKLSDFGSACTTIESSITEYFVSRFYRAPEIILGLKYDQSIDMWAVGATLYELYTGKVMFPGCSNNEMLKLFMDAKGMFPQKMIKNAVFRDKHFDHQSNFIYRKIDTIFQMETVKVLKPLQSKILADNLFNWEGLSLEEETELKQFKDLLDKMMQLNPDSRISIEAAFKHPFINK